MKHFRGALTALVAGIVLLAGAAVDASAQRKNDREVRDVVRSLNSKLDDFQSDLSYQLKSGSADPQEVDDVLADLKSLKDGVGSFESNLDARRENREDVTNIIDAATSINSFLDENRQNGRIESDWGEVRTLIGRLSSNYGVTP
ncbi:MAG: hypothetical protein ABI999_10205, partial [Acidobacteriota bacterium]